MSANQRTELDRLADRIAALEGHLLAAECVINALALSLPKQAGVVLQALHATEVLAYGDALAHTGAPEAEMASFRRHSERALNLLDCKDLAAETAGSAACSASRCD